MATAYEPEEESLILEAPKEDCEESEVVDDTVDLEKRTEINLKDIEENNGLVRGLNKLTGEKELEQVSKYVTWDYQVNWENNVENELRFYHLKLELSYDVTNSDMRKKEVGDLIFYYLTKEVEPDEHACIIIGRLDNPNLYTHESWISDCSYWLHHKITFAQFYSRVGNKCAALEQLVYKHKAFMLNKHSALFIDMLEDVLPYDTLHKMMTDVRDENGQTAMFHITPACDYISSIFKHSTDDLYKLLSIQDNNEQTALHVNPCLILETLTCSYRTKLRQKTVDLFNIKDKNNKIAVDLIKDESLKDKLTQFVDQVEQRKYALRMQPQVLIIYTTKNRPGAEEEANTIYDAFGLKYTTKYYITRKKDKTKEEMLKLLKEASRGLQSAALIVIIMSHGSVGVIHDSEGKAVTLTSIEDAMCANENNKDLPKILITQCCQVTDDPPSASYIDPSAPSSETGPTDGPTDGPTPSQESRTPYVPKNDHFCAIMSCVSGQESTRGVFIPKLAEEIKRSKGQESIIDLAGNVSSAMEEEGYKQIPIIQTTLRGTVTPDALNVLISWCRSKDQKNQKKQNNRK